MLSAICYFRKNYMTAASAKALLDNICAQPELQPDYWNVFEPINLPFHSQDLTKVLDALAPALPQVRSLVFFVRKRRPAFLLTMNLQIAPTQGTTAHNYVSLDLKKTWNGGECVLAQYLARSILPNYPDYASIPNWEQDSERYAEFRRSYTPKEFVEMLAQPKLITAPFGPYGCLGDVQWFNYFGRVYVDFIGRSRLISAGWTRVGRNW